MSNSVHYLVLWYVDHGGVPGTRTADLPIRDECSKGMSCLWLENYDHARIHGRIHCREYHGYVVCCVAAIHQRRQDIEERTAGQLRCTDERELGYLKSQCIEDFNGFMMFSKAFLLGCSKFFRQVAERDVSPTSVLLAAIIQVNTHNYVLSHIFTHPVKSKFSERKTSKT